MQLSIPGGRSGEERMACLAAAQSQYQESQQRQRWP